MATAADVLTRLREKLNDSAGTRWPDAEHFRAMTDAQNAIIEARPDLFETFANMTPVAGAVQSVPADCYLLFEVVGNLDSSNKLASPITKIDRTILDRQKPGWMVMTAKAAADYWMQAKRERGKFYVCPPQPTSPGKFYIRYAKRPTAITASGNTLGVNEEMVNAVYNFCMHRALEKDEKFAGSPVAASYMEKFGQFLGVKASAEDQTEADEMQREGA